MLITEILKKNSEKYPQDIALIEIDATCKSRNEITWKKFEKSAKNIANALTEYGIQKSDKVSILMTNCLDWLPIYFGILKTGALASPLNFRFDVKEISYCINLVESKLIFFEEEFIERINKAKNLETNSISKTINHYIYVGDISKKPDFAISFKDFLKKGKNKNIEFLHLTIKDNAALYFTSGTTGVPKATLLTHRNLEFACELENNHHNQKKEDNFLCIPPLYHTGAKMHWFGNFIVGAKAVLLKGVNAKYIIETIAKEKVSIVWLLVPWIHDILIAIENKEIELKNYNLSSLRLMHSGAQPIPPSLIKKWKKIFPHHQYDTNYGLTETTGPGCVHLGIENIHKVGTIGKAGFGWQTKVVDKKLQSLAFGETGELLVKGDGLMKEYYKNPKETQKTIKDGWLCTGDMAKVDEAGFISLIDRKKDIIVSGGENIYPVQIEDFLIENEKIHDVAIIGLKDNRLGEIVAAIIQVKKNKTLEKDEVKKFCQSLPRYKRPKEIFFDNVPRNPTGKIEKPKLRRKYKSPFDIRHQETFE